MIILRQKEYNLTSDLKYSGVRRTLKKNIGRARRKIAGRLDESISNDLKEKRKLEKDGQKVGERLHVIPETTKLAKERIQQLNNSGKIKVCRGGIGTNGVDEIYVPELISLGELNHELGHIRNRTGKNGLLARVSSKVGQSEKSLDELDKIDTLTNNPVLGLKKVRAERTRDKESLEDANRFLESSKLSDAADRFIRGKLLIADEVGASKWGLENARKSGLSSSILALEKQRQDIANNTYKRAVSASVKIPIRNKIQIPSRRGNLNLQ